MIPSNKPTKKSTSKQSHLQASLSRLISREAIDAYSEIILILAIGLTPLIFSPVTNELFEFPKMIFVYFLAIASLAVICLRVHQTKQFIFLNTPLNKPILFFIFTFIISTVLSIDLYTSVAGYYSRFNGGLASIIAYLILFYLALIYLTDHNDTRPTKKLHQANQNAQATSSDLLRQSFASARLQIKSLRLLWAWLISSAVVSIWGILEHFGYDPSCYILNGTFTADCWVQDVQARVFSTFGQPNWLATYLVATIPVGIAMFALQQSTWLRRAAWLVIVLNYAAFWYTYSRSGWIGLVAALIVCIPIFSYIHRQRLWIWLITLSLTCLVISLSSLSMATERTATSLESGNFDSSTGQIRLLVWQGSVDTFWQNPLFGSGPETFAFSFLPQRPAELNQTTEWNFLYNKAHNEVLNTAVTLGIVGLAAWLFLYFKIGKIVWNGYITYRHDHQKPSYFLIQISLFSGIVGMFASQLLGFSVVTTNLLFWLGTAMIVAPEAIVLRHALLNNPARRTAVGLMVAIIILASWLTSRYFAAEIFATRGASTSSGIAAHNYRQAISLNPLEPKYHQQLSYIYAYMAQFGGSQSQHHYMQLAVDQAKTAEALNPFNILNLKALTYTYQQLGQIESKYQLETIRVAQAALKLDPHDAVAHQLVAQALHDAEMSEQALATYNSIIDLRPNAAHSYKLRSQFFQQNGDTQKAIDDLQRALKIEPNNLEIKKELQELQVGE